MWNNKNGRLTATFTFKDFAEAFAFMTRIALIAEKMDHHPDWKQSYNTVEIELYTHSESAVTNKDHQLAGEIERIYRGQRKIFQA